MGPINGFYGLELRGLGRRYRSELARTPWKLLVGTMVEIRDRGVTSRLIVCAEERLASPHMATINYKP